MKMLFKRSKVTKTTAYIFNDKPTGTMTAPSKQFEDITMALQERWEQIEKECKKREHKNRKEYWLNYCHVQLVHLCKECYELGQEEHKILYNKLIKEGYIP